MYRLIVDTENYAGNFEREREKGLLALLEEQSWGVVQDDLRAKQKASMK